jgi:hypothetical protein
MPRTEVTRQLYREITGLLETHGSLQPNASWEHMIDGMPVLSGAEVYDRPRRTLALGGMVVRHMVPGMAAFWSVGRRDKVALTHHLDYINATRRNTHVPGFANVTLPHLPHLPKVDSRPMYQVDAEGSVICTAVRPPERFGRVHYGDVLHPRAEPESEEQPGRAARNPGEVELLLASVQRLRQIDPADLTSRGIAGWFRRS